MQRWLDSGTVDVSIQFVDRPLHAESKRAHCDPFGGMVLPHGFLSLRLRILEGICGGISRKRGLGATL